MTEVYRTQGPGGMVPTGSEYRTARPVYRMDHTIYPVSSTYYVPGGLQTTHVSPASSFWFMAWARPFYRRESWSSNC